jgi:hypothetical protein
VDPNERDDRQLVDPKVVRSVDFSLIRFLLLLILRARTKGDRAIMEFLVLSSKSMPLSLEVTERKLGSFRAVSLNWSSSSVSFSETSSTPVDFKADRFRVGILGGELIMSELRRGGKAREDPIALKDARTFSCRSAGLFMEASPPLLRARNLGVITMGGEALLPSTPNSDPMAPMAARTFSCLSAGLLMEESPLLLRARNRGVMTMGGGVVLLLSTPVRATESDAAAQLAGAEGSSIEGIATSCKHFKKDLRG